MADLSALGIKITSSGVVKTTQELTGFSKAASAARNTASKPINIKFGNTGIAKALVDIQKLDRALSAVGGKDLSSAVKIAQAMSKIEIANNKAAVSAQKLAQEMARTEAAQSRAAVAAAQLSAAQSKSASAAAIAEKSQLALAQAHNRVAQASNANLMAINRNITAMNASYAATRQADAHVKAYQQSLSQIPAAANQASAGVNKLNKTVNDSVNNMQATPGNIAAQFQDIGVTAAMGMSPMLIALQQGTQLSSAFAGGGLKQLGAAFKQLISPVSLLTIGVVGLSVYLIQLAMDFFTASKGADELKKAEDALTSSVKSLIASREALDRSLGKNIGLYTDLRLRALEAAQAEMKSAEATLAAAQVRLKAAQAEQATRDAMLQSPEVAAAGGFFNPFGFGSDSNIKEAATQVRTDAAALEEAAALLNTASASIHQAITDHNKQDKPKKERVSAAERLAERLEREAEATRILTQGNYEAADAYRKSTAAGKIAEVAAEARAKGIKAQGDAAIYATRELKKYVSEQAASGAANNASIREQITQQRMVNQAVADGTLTVDNASTALSNMAEQRKILNALQVARLNKDYEGEKVLVQILEDLRKAQMEYNEEVRKGADLAAADSVNRGIPQLQKEIELERKLGKERMKALLGLSGDALENELARINDERERGGILLEYEAKIASASAAGHYKLVEALEAERKKRLELLGVQQGNANQERTLEQNRQYALDTAHDIAGIIGGSIGTAADKLIDAFSEFDKLTGGSDTAGIGKFLKETKLFGKALGDIFKEMGAGAKIGGAVDGIFDAIGIKSSKTGAQIGGAIGQFAGPLGAIAGSIVGGLVGGMLKSTPRASATVSIIAGEAMDTAIKGSSDKLRKAAGQMANGVIDGLLGLADQLGAQLVGDASVSIGMRKGNYRVDPTGSGITKTSKGAVDFGEDQAAAIAYAMQVAIQQGVLDGLSESMKRLIMGDGDLQTQISKALSFKGVFDELAQKDDPAKWAQDQVTLWRAGMDKIFKEAGATSEELAELERLTGIKRANAATEAADKIASAERDAMQRQNEIRDKNIELLEAQGKLEEAEAAARQARIADAPDYLREIQEQIEAANAARAATEKATTAEQALTAAREAAFAEGRTNFEAQQRLEIEIYRLLGDESAALRKERELELYATNALLIEKTLYKYALEDEAKATAEATKAAEAAAAAERAIIDERMGLMRQLWTMTGNTAALQADALSQLDVSNRPLQQYIWNLEAQKEAQEAAAQAMADQTSALNETISKFRDFASQIREFRDGLIGSVNPAVGLAQSRAKFANTSTMAGLGNEASLSAFTGDAQAYLDAAQSSGSYADYQQALASVLSGSNTAISGAEGMATMAERQIALMQSTMHLTGFISEGVNDLNSSFNDHLPVLTETVATSIDDLVEAMKGENSKDREVYAELKLLLEQLVLTNNRIERVVSRNEGDGGFAVNTGGSVVTVGNTPLPVEVITP